MNRYKIISGFLFLILANLACGIQLAPGEIQLFTGDEPVITATFTPWPTATPIPTPTATPTIPATPEYRVVEAASKAPPAPPPLTNPQDVAILRYIDSDSVEVRVNGFDYTLPYATLPPPPQPTPQPTLPLVWDARLTELGVGLTRAPAQPGQPVYRLTNAYFKDDGQAGGLHHIYVEVLDETGQRILGQPVTQAWSSGQAVGYTENKPYPEFAVNFPIYGVQGPDNYSIYITDANSDVVYGLGLPAGQLASYWLTFQRQ